MPSYSKHAPVRAAQYLRISQEHRRYSARNQARAILAYAAGTN